MRLNHPFEHPSLTKLELPFYQFNHLFLFLYFLIYNLRTFICEASGIDETILNSNTHLISISFDFISPIEFPINAICSSLTPDRLTLIQRNSGTDESNACKNCGSTRCFLFLSNTDIPSILMWLIVDDFNAFAIALNVFVASSKWIIQLHIFNVFSSL